jgi:hypothetical protein
MCITLWLEQMQSFTDAAITQINADPQALERLAGADITALASSLTWLGERLYYLAATHTPPSTIRTPSSTPWCIFGHPRSTADDRFT